MLEPIRVLIICAPHSIRADCQATVLDASNVLFFCRANRELIGFSREDLRPAGSTLTKAPQWRGFARRGRSSDLAATRYGQTGKGQAEEGEGGGLGNIRPVRGIVVCDRIREVCRVPKVIGLHDDA